MNILLYLGTLISLLAIDSVWLFSMGAQYRTWLSGLFAPAISWAPVLVFYPLYALGLVFFVISPALRKGVPWWSVLLTGLFFGLIAYAAYDLTNQATLKDWPLIVTIVDMAWGATLSGLTSLLVYSVVSYFK